MGKIITVASQKGGTGKTTAAYIISHGLYERGHNVLVLDSDDQASILDYCNQRSLTSPSEEFDLSNFFNQAKITQNSPYRKSLRAAKDRFDYVVIDTSGSFSAFHNDLIKESDHVIIPVEASRTDLVASLIVVEAVALENVNRDDKEKVGFSYILQKGDENTNDFAYYNTLITQRFGGLPYIPFSLSLRAMTGVGYTPIDAIHYRSTIKQIVEQKRQDEIETFEERIQTPEIKAMAEEIKAITVEPKAPTFTKKEIERTYEQLMQIVDELIQRVDR